MVEEIMTFGECLEKIMKDKKISVTKLAELTGTKSRNSIQRILRDDCSIIVIEAFKHKLSGLDELLLSEAERLNEAFEVSRVGKDTYLARKIMLQIFENPQRLKTNNPVGFNPSTHKTVSLAQLLNTYHKFAKIRILIFDMTFSVFTHELVNLIRSSPYGSISISHILLLTDNQVHNAETFVAAFNLLNYGHYDVYCLTHAGIPTNQLTIAPNSIFIDKETKDGRHYTDIIKMYSAESFSYIIDLRDHQTFEFYLYQFNNMRIKAQSIRKTYEKTSPVVKTLGIVEACIPLEKHCDRYLIKHSISSSMIPFNVYLSIFSGNNYFGLSKNDPMVEDLKKNFHERTYCFFNAKKTKMNLLTKRGLLDFVNNRVISDHFHNARPFTREEIKNILEFVLEQLLNNEYFKILLLKNDYAIGNLEFSYYENQCLWIWDSFSGYGDDYFDTPIENPQIIEIFDDFVKNEYIPHHTLPESETIDFFKYLISIA